MDSLGSFGQWLRHRRRELDLTQDVLARRVGCARITIRKLEGGKMRPSKELATLLIEELGVPLEERENFVRFARGGLLPSSPATKMPPNNIPNAISSFVGRELELAEVKKLIKNSRLVTLSGAGGIGKTRFAMQVATQLLDSFKDGIWWVELAGLHAPALVMSALAKVLGVREIPNQPMVETLANFLRTQQVLIILDNCEHLIEACALAAEQLLTACMDLKILATSRESLGITGEMNWQVPPLALPEVQALSSTPLLLQYEAILLFTHRATTVNQYFALNLQNAPAVLQICRYLDGIPLAIELAAARVKTLSPEQIAARLDDRFTLLTSESRTAPPRLRTLRATLDWSHDLLTEAEKELFRQLSVFIGGFTLEALELVTRLDVDHTVIDVLSRIVDKSLVMVQQWEDVRYQLLETIRQYAREKLEESGETSWIRNRHFDYFLMLAENAESHLFGAEQKDWTNRLELEHNNLRSALTWSLDSNQAETGLQMAGTLARYWLNNGYLSEGHRWLDKFLAVNDRVLTKEKAKALHQSSIISRYMGDNIRAKALAISSIKLYREIGDNRGLGLALTDLGAVFHLEGNREEAIELLQESLGLLQSTDDLWGIAYTHLWLGDSWFRLRDTARAASHWEEGLRLTRQLGDHSLLAWSLGGLADVARLRGDYKRATEMFRESLSIYRELGNRSEPPLTLEALGLVAAAGGQSQRATRLWGAASAWREAINEPLPSAYEADYASLVAQVRSQLGEKIYASVWLEGHAMSPEQAIEYALQT